MDVNTDSHQNTKGGRRLPLLLYTTGLAAPFYGPVINNIRNSLQVYRPKDVRNKSGEDLWANGDDQEDGKADWSVSRCARLKPAQGNGE